MKKSLIIVIILVIVIAIIGVVYFASLNKEQPTNANEQQESINQSVTYTLDYEGKNMTPGQAFSKEIFGEEEQNSRTPYHYTPGGGNQNNDKGATDFVGIIKENQVRKI